MGIREIAQRIFISFFVILATSAFAAWLSRLILSLITGEPRYIWYTVYWNPETSWDGEVIPPLLVISFLTSLAWLFLYSKRDLKNAEMLRRHGLGFAWVITVVLSVMTLWEWLDWGEPIFVVVVIIAALFVYAVVLGVDFLQSKLASDKLNQQLKKNREINSS